MPPAHTPTADPPTVSAPMPPGAPVPSPTPRRQARATHSSRPAPREPRRDPQQPQSSHRLPNLLDLDRNFLGHMVHAHVRAAILQVPVSADHVGRLHGTRSHVVLRTAIG